MPNDLEDLAGDRSHHDEDARRETCIAELQPAIRRLLARGMPAGTIVAALACASVRVLDEQRRH